MIGSFWNLCRACPSMPVDKQLHSEYRSTYRWHEFTGNARPEVVRRAPVPNPSQFAGQTNEPPLPRRKKCPELAYKSHEFIIGSEYTDSRSNANTRVARSEERGGTPSRRSKSEGPPVVPNGRAYPIATEIDGTSTKQAGESNGLFKKTITKLSTEYRLQFVWPNVRRIKGLESNKSTATEQPKKSLSMGAIKSNQQSVSQHIHHQKMMAAQPTVHKKRTTNQKEATLHELEPLVSDAEDKKPFEKQVTIVEKKIALRPFSQTFDQERLNHFITKKENFGFADEVDNKRQQQHQETILMNGSSPPHSKPNLDLWFKEVIELRKKAGEYKSRGWGVEIDPELYKKQRDLWEQVSKNSSLSALSLASSLHRPITKEEKEEENNKKSIPAEKSQKSRVPGQAYLIDNKNNEISALPARFANIRHHLERTTGPDVEEGALLPSPTREKLMPAITKRESESQRGSPKKTAASRHGSPQKGSPQKGSPKKILKTRSQSVGPDHESPKRQVRSASTAPTAKTSAYSGKKTPTSGTAPTTDRKPRPSSLSTTFHSRIKSSSLPPSASGRTHTVQPVSTNSSTTTTYNTTAGNKKTSSTANQQTHPSQIKSSLSSTPSTLRSNTLQMRKKDKDKQNISFASGHGHGHGYGHGHDTVAHGGSQPPKAQPSSKPSSATIATSTSTIAAPTSTLAQTTSTTIPTASTPTITTTTNKKPIIKIPLPLVNGLNDVTLGTTGTTGTTTTTTATTMKQLNVPGQDKQLAENEGEDGRETAISISSASPQPAPEIPDEPIVKSPPEPTRVKSPEQILMRSPDPVNWTVPLDTGKTFTVTQNVKEGESFSRPQSEIKASTPVEKPPPPPQSAPPELTEQTKMDGWKKNPQIGGTNDLTDTKTSLSSSSPTTTAIGRITSITVQPKAGTGIGSSGGGIPATIRYETKAMPGKTVRCLDDGNFEVDYIGGSISTTSPSPSSSLLLPSAALGAGTLSTVTPTATATTTASSSIIEDLPITTNPIGSVSTGFVSGPATGSTIGTGTGTAIGSSGSSARSTAADVLEKARDRFDRFWGGNTTKEDKV